MRAGIAMRADIDNERPGRDFDLVCAQEEQHIDAAGFRHVQRAVAAFARNESDIERADTRGGSCAVR